MTCARSHGWLLNVLSNEEGLNCFLQSCVFLKLSKIAVTCPSGINLDLPKVSKMTINFELVKVRKITSLKIYVSLVMDKQVNVIQRVPLGTQPPELAVSKLSQNFLNTHRKSPVLESLFNKAAGLQECYKTHLLQFHSRFYFSLGKTFKNINQLSRNYVSLKNVKFKVMFTEVYSETSQTSMMELLCKNS